MGALWAHLCHQRLAPSVDVDQSQHRKHPVGVLGKAPITHLGKTPQAFERQKRVLHFGAGLAFGGVDLFVAFAQGFAAVCAFEGASLLLLGPLL